VVLGVRFHDPGRLIDRSDYLPSQPRGNHTASSGFDFYQRRLPSPVTFLVISSRYPSGILPLVVATPAVVVDSEFVLSHGIVMADPQSCRRATRGIVASILPLVLAAVVPPS
jgi:hypothetical protein